MIDIANKRPTPMIWKKGNEAIGRQLDSILTKSVITSSGETQQGGLGRYQKQMRACDPVDDNGREKRKKAQEMMSQQHNNT